MRLIVVCGSPRMVTFSFGELFALNAFGELLSVTRQKVTKERVGEGFSNIPPQTPPKRHKGSCDSPCEPPLGFGFLFLLWCGGGGVAFCYAFYYV